MAHTRLILLVNETLDMNIEVGAALLDDDLTEIEKQVQAEEEKADRQIDQAFAKLKDKATWEDGSKFAMVLRSIRKAIYRARDLEVLEDQLKAERFNRMANARALNSNESTLIEVMHTEACRVESLRVYSATDYQRLEA